MKKRLLIFNYSVLAAILFTVLYQSVHSFEHLVKQLTTEHCHHKYNGSNTAEITHSHHDYDHCFVCKYSFSNYIPTTIYSAEFFNVVSDTTRLFGYGEKLVFFTGSFYNLRGPPSFIV
jgi:hypothetical protein